MNYKFFILLSLTHFTASLYTMDPHQGRVVKSLFPKNDHYREKMALHLTRIAQSNEPMMINIEPLEEAILIESLFMPGNILVAEQRKKEQLQQQCHKLREEIERLQKEKKRLELPSELTSSHPLIVPTAALLAGTVFICGVSNCIVQ